MLGDFDALFSGKKSFVINDNEEEAEDIAEDHGVPEAGLNKKSNLKFKCEAEIAMAKGNKKKKIKLKNEQSKKVELKVKKVRQIETENGRTNTCPEGTVRSKNISDKLKSISSKVKPIDYYNNKTKMEKLSEIKDKCASYTSKLKPKIEEVVLVTDADGDEATSSKSPLVDENSDFDSHGDKTTKNKKTNESTANKKKMLKPAQAVQKFVAGNKKKYTDKLNKMLVGLEGGKLSNQFDPKNKRRVIKKVKKYLKANARNEKKKDKKMKKKVKKGDPIEDPRNKRRKRRK